VQLVISAVGTDANQFMICWPQLLINSSHACNKISKCELTISLV
jgi:hypothetical protein